MEWARARNQDEPRLLALVVWLKSYQRLGYFPKADDVPPAVVRHVRDALGLAGDVELEPAAERTAKRYRELVRARMKVTYDAARVRHVAEQAISKAVQAKDNPADLINVALEELVRARCELPGYTTLDAMATAIRTEVNAAFYQAVAGRVDLAARARLARLLLADPVTRRSEFDRLKDVAKAASLGKFKQRLELLASMRRGGAGHRRRRPAEGAQRGQAADADREPRPRRPGRGPRRRGDDVLQADGRDPPEGPRPFGGAPGGPPSRVRAAAGRARRRPVGRPRGHRARHRRGRAGPRTARCRGGGRAAGAQDPGAGRRGGGTVRRARGGGRPPRQQLPAAAGPALPLSPERAVHAGGCDRAGGDQRRAQRGRRGRVPAGPARLQVRLRARTPGGATPRPGRDGGDGDPGDRRGRLRIGGLAQAPPGEEQAGDAGAPPHGGVRVLLPGRRATVRRHRGDRVGLLRQPPRPAHVLGGVPPAGGGLLRPGRDTVRPGRADRPLPVPARRGRCASRRGVPVQHRPGTRGRPAGAQAPQGRRAAAGGAAAGGRDP